MRNRDEDELTRLPGNRLKSGSSEIQNWIVAAAAQDLEMKLIQ
jgi:hypothetical protein